MNKENECDRKRLKDRRKKERGIRMKSERKRERNIKIVFPLLFVSRIDYSMQE